MKRLGEVLMGSGILVRGERRGRTLYLTAGGSWTAGQAGELEHLLDEWLDRTRGLTAVFVELGSVRELDSFGAWLLERLRRRLVDRGLSVTIEGFNGHGRELFEQMQQFRAPRSSGISPDARSLKRLFAGHGNPVSGALQTTGRAVESVLHDFRIFANLLGSLVMAFWRVLVRPRSFRLASSVHQLDRVGWKAVPIILLITFLIGGIIAQQGFFHFSKFGADIYVVDMVGILVLRELGVLLVAIMVAGRSGSAFTAELGSMKMREEIDALETMGLDPVELLILPRVLVLVLALPLLTFLGSMAALYGGGLVAWLYGGMSPDIYIERLKEAINMTHFKVGMIKAPFMGAMIGIIACMEGFQVRGSAASLGQQTTRSVVKSIFMVIVLDGVFAVFFASIGM